MTFAIRTSICPVPVASVYMDKMADKPLKITYEQPEGATLFQEVWEQGWRSSNCRSILMQNSSDDAAKSTGCLRESLIKEIKAIVSSQAVPYEKFRRL